METNKLMPNDKDLEESVLGSIMLFSENSKSCTEILHNDVFYHSVNKKIYKAIESLIEQKINIDMISVVSELKKMKQLESIGGAYFISTLVNKVTTSVNAEYHCRILLQYYYSRCVINLGHKMQIDAFDPANDIFDTITNVENTIKQIRSGTEPNVIKTNNEIIEEVITEIEMAANNKGIIGLSSGLPNLDHAVMGFQGGCKYVIAARPSVGKSSLAKTICIHFANVEKKKGIFFSMEMTPQKLMVSIIAEMLSIDNSLLKSGKITQEQKEQIRSLKNTFFSDNFIIEEKPALSPDKIRSRINKEMERGKVHWIAIDYLGLMKLPGNSSKNMSKEQIISDITAELKTIAKEYNIPVIELSQLSRETEKRSDFRPKLSDLKDSGAIEANADTVILVYRPEYHGIKHLSSNGPSSEGFAELIIAKNRDGRCMSIAAKFEGKYTAFKNHESGVELDVSHVEETLEDVF